MAQVTQSGLLCKVIVLALPGAPPPFGRPAAQAVRLGSASGFRGAVPHHWSPPVSRRPSRPVSGHHPQPVTRCHRRPIARWQRLPVPLHRHRPVTFERLCTLDPSREQGLHCWRVGCSAWGPPGDPQFPAVLVAVRSPAAASHSPVSGGLLPPSPPCMWMESCARCRSSVVVVFVPIEININQVTKSDSPYCL